MSACEQVQGVAGDVERDVELVGNVRHGHDEIAVDAPADVAAELVEWHQAPSDLGVDGSFVTSDDRRPLIRHAVDVAATVPFVVDQLVSEHGAAVEPAESCVERDPAAAVGAFVEAASAGVEVRPLEVDVVSGAQVAPRVPSSAAHTSRPYETGVTAMSSTLADQGEHR